MAKETSLRQLFMDEMKDVYHAEKQLTKALPKMMKAATSSELREAFESHLGETEGHIKRLELVFESLGETPKAKPCAGMAGIVEEGSKLLQEAEKGSVMDAGLISAAQRVEHYEMAAYGTLVAWANVLGEDAAVEQLEATLEEEKAADERLSEIAEGGVNESASAGDEADKDEDALEASDDGEDDETDRPAKQRRGATAKSPSRSRTTASVRR